MYNKICTMCNKEFTATGPAGKYCPACQEIRVVQIREEQRIRVAAERAASGKIKYPGVGKGGAPHSGKLNPMYKHGLYVFETLRNEIKESVRYCERCRKDLLEATQHMWVVHHKDHDHWNHVASNLELLCKRCHQVEHECWKAFTKEQRLSPRGVEASASKC